MRTKLAILEGMSELPPRQRIRALELLVRPPPPP